jgi:uncharacterized membrane protein YkoI
MGKVFHVFVLTTGLMVGLNASAFGQDRKKGDEKPKESTIIQLDASKLPPELAKQLIDFAKSMDSQKGEKGQYGEKGRTSKKVENTGDTDAISLSKAITIAEMAGKGRATNAQRKDKGAVTTFTVEVTVPGGDRIRYYLDASGTITQQKKGERD